MLAFGFAKLCLIRYSLPCRRVAPFLFMPVPPQFPNPLPAVSDSNFDRRSPYHGKYPFNPSSPVYLHHIPQYVRMIHNRCMMQLISNQNHESKLMHGAIEKIVRTNLLFLTKNRTLHFDKDVTCFSVWMISGFDYTPPPLTFIFTNPSLSPYAPPLSLLLTANLKSSVDQHMKKNLAVRLPSNPIDLSV